MIDWKIVSFLRVIFFEMTRNEDIALAGKRAVKINFSLKFDQFGGA